MDNLWMLFAAAGVMVAIIGGLALLGDHYTLNNIKSKTVGDGQHGTARWATDAEIRKTYALVPFLVSDWRAGKNLPGTQGLVLGSSSRRGITALVDKDDVHCLMIGASGVGKTAYFLYPNLEYACACGMSFLWKADSLRSDRHGLTRVTQQDTSCSAASAAFSTSHWRAAASRASFFSCSSRFFSSSRDCCAA